MIKSLSLKNWKSHKDTELEFTEETNVIVGEMGSGKTSAIEAISYGLFGTYPSLRSREITLDQTIMNKPRKENQAEVKVEFTANGETYTVERKIERGKTTKAQLRKEGKLIEGPSTRKVTNTVEEILGINYELFSKAVYAEQNRMNYFLEIPRGKRREKIDQLLELERWENARKNLTTVVNILEDRKKEKKKKSKETEGTEKIKSLENKVKKLEKEVKKKEKERKKIKKKLKTKKRKHKKEKKKKKKNKKLEQKINSLENRIQYLEKDLEELPEAENKEKVKEKLQELKKKKKQIKKKTKEKNKLETQIETLQETLEDKEKEIKEKKKKIKEIKPEEKAKEKLEKVEKDLDELESKVKENQIKSNQLDKDLEEEKNHLEKLKAEEAECPVCGSDLTGGRKKKVVQDKKQDIKSLEKAKKKKRKKIKTLQKKIKKKKEKKKELEKEKKKVKEKKELKEDLKELKKELKENKEKMKKLKKKKKQIKVEEDEEKIEEKIKKTQEELEYIEKSKEKSKKQKKLKKKKKEKEELEFSEEKLQELYDELKSLENKKNILKEKINSNRDMEKEKKKRLKELKEKKEKAEKARKKAKYLDNQLNSLKNLKNSLNRVQDKLREKFTEETNIALDNVWRKIYPYGNYETLKLDVEDGDYILQAKIPGGEWIDVEGRTSGGERSTAGLCLRIALALVLTGDLSWIILDEPTHNMDEKAIENLSVALGSYLHEIIDQVFIITHEPMLKKASSGTFYRFSRDKEENEPTNVLRE